MSTITPKRHMFSSTRDVACFVGVEAISCKVEEMRAQGCTPCCILYDHLTRTIFVDFVMHKGIHVISKTTRQMTVDAIWIC